jgi:hypothetical protein
MLSQPTQSVLSASNGESLKINCLNLLKRYVLKDTIMIQQHNPEMVSDDTDYEDSQTNEINKQKFGKKKTDDISNITRSFFDKTSDDSKFLCKICMTVIISEKISFLIKLIKILLTGDNNNL